MRYFRLIAVAAVCSTQPARAQTAIKEAFVLTKMMDKFHVQPKPLNDSLSSAVFNNFFKEADPYKILFTKEDIQQLESFRYQLDDEIKQQRSSFIPLVQNIYQKRITETDSLFSLLCKTPLNFTVNESISASEKENFPATAYKKTKLSKYLKANIIASVAETLADDSSLTINKTTLDSLTGVEQKHLQTRYKRLFTLLLNGPAAIEENIKEHFCEAIAGTYDPHSDYFTLNTKQNFEHELGNVDYDYGFSLKEDEDGNAGIGNLRPGTAAFKSGLLSEGDKIRSVKWEGRAPVDVSDASPEELNRILKTGNDKPVTLVIKKIDGSIKEVTLSQTKKEIDEDEDAERVKSFVLKNKLNVGYISLPSFYSDWENDDDKNVNGCANDIAKEILKLRKENISALILDLRYNGGGSVQEAMELAGIFIDAGPVAQAKSREPKPIVLKDVNRGTIYDGPLFILVNRYSASASEFLAASLQDYKRAIIVGAPTYGKATGQLVVPLDTAVVIDDKINQKKAASYVKITMSTLYRITGETVQAKGVVPDIILPERTDDDEKNEAAEPFHLVTTAIEANKYYKPYVNNWLSGIQTIANEETAAEKYFSELKTFNEKRNAAKNKPFELNLTTAVTAIKNNIGKDIEEAKAKQRSFTVDITGLEKEKLATNPDLRLMNESIMSNLESDPYIGTTFRIIERLIKQ